jgi:predicted nucleotidyltransferase
VTSLPARYVDALRALRAIWEPEQLLVIGAAAIEVHLGLRWRRTLDLDLSVAADLDAYAMDLLRLGWRRHQNAPQRWITPDGALIDVLPGHASLIRQGGFTWPDGSTWMNLVGFRLAFADAVAVEIAPGLAVRFASLRSLVPLKIAAYLDRPWERDSDLGDIAHILREFLGPQDDDQRWAEAILDLALDFEDVGPFLLGRQLGERVDEAERALVLSFLAVIEDPSDRLSTLQRMVRNAPAGWRSADSLALRLNAFRRGFEAPIPSVQ